MWPTEQPTSPATPYANAELLEELRELRRTQTRILETQAGQQASLNTVQGYVLELHQEVIAGRDGRPSMVSRIDALELTNRFRHGSLQPPRQWRSVVMIASSLIAALVAGLTAGALL